MLIWGALSAAIAVACAYSDFNTNVSDQRALSVLSLRSLAVWLFLLTMGALGFGAWWWLISAHNSWIENLIVFKDAQPYVRAALVGLAVPTVAKAGAFYVGGNGIGIEYVYNLFRGWATDKYIDCASVMAERWAQQRLADDVSQVDAQNLLSSICERIRDGKRRRRSRLELFLADAYQALQGAMPLTAEYGNVADLEDKVKKALGNGLAGLTEAKRKLIMGAILRAAIRQTNLSFVRRTFVAQLPAAASPWWRFWQRA